MAKSYAGAKGRSKTQPFLMLPKKVINSDEFRALGAWEVKLVVDLGGMYHGLNNGDLSAAWKLMCKRGWHSKGTLHKASQKTLDAGFLMVTRQGGRNRPTLYALTFFAINECDDKLEVSATNAPPNTWRKK